MTAPHKLLCRSRLSELIALFDMTMARPHPTHAQCTMHRKHKLLSLYDSFSKEGLEPADLKECTPRDLHELMTSLKVPVAKKLRLKRAIRELREKGGGGGSGMMIVGDAEKKALGRVGALINEVREMVKLIPAKVEGMMCGICVVRVHCTSLQEPLISTGAL